MDRQKTPQQKIQEREIQLTQESAEKQREEARKNRDFFMVFDDTGSKALQSVALKSGQSAAAFMWLASNMDRQGAIVISNATLAEAIGIPPSNMPRTLKILRDSGLIYTLTTGGQNVHCINPDIAWRSTEEGKQYALFHARVIVQKEEILAAQEQARIKRNAAAEGMELRSVRAKILKPKGKPKAPSPQQDLPKPVGNPATEVHLEPETTTQI